MPRRYILTGAPGAGKTTTARHLAAAGHTVIAEAATDLITAGQAAGIDAPWDDPALTDQIAALQRERQHRADALPGPVQFFDRSPVCTLAMARFTGHEPGPVLLAELDRITTERIYQTTVLLFDLLDTITPTNVRRVTLDEARAFEHVHLDAYAEYGFRIERLPPLPVADRAALAERLTS